MSDEKNGGRITEPFEQRAEAVLACVFRGLHHCPEIHKFSYGWEVNTNSLSTVDFDQLTRLVVAAHDMCVRAQVQQGGPRQVKILLSPRGHRTGGIYDRHPTMEDALSEVRRSLPPAVVEQGATPAEEALSAKAPYLAEQEGGK